MGEVDPRARGSPQLGEYARRALARPRAGNLMPHTEVACDMLCGMSAGAAAAAITDECLADLPPDGRQTAYEQWRLRIQERLTCRTKTLQ